VYPLWLCPFKICNTGAQIIHGGDNDDDDDDDDVDNGDDNGSNRDGDKGNDGGECDNGRVHSTAVRKGSRPGGKSALRGLINRTRTGESLFVDVGAYGNPTVKPYIARETTRKLEEFVRKHEGFQMMYADSYMSKDEFRGMFDHSLYDKVREEFPIMKEAFPEIYDKVCKAARI
jgi:hypothetical protein